MRAVAIRFSVFLILAAAAGATPATAHGVRTEVVAGAPTVVTITHTDGSPLVDTPFTVFAPGRAEPYLAGATDRHGRVVFLPDMVGAWKVRVAAVDGHGAVVTVDIDSTALAGASGAPAAVQEHDHDHDHAHDHAPGEAHDHAHDHDHAHPAPPASGDRWLSAAAGLAVLVIVLAVAALAARRRRR